MLKFRRRRPSDVEPTEPMVVEPPEPTMTVYVMHRDYVSYCTTRFYFTGELLRSDNERILEELTDSFELVPDSDIRPGIRFYRHHVSVSWFPDVDAREYEYTMLISLMCNVLSEVFVMDVNWEIIEDDPMKPRQAIERLVNLSVRLGVDWDPTSTQP